MYARDEAWPVHLPVYVYDVGMANGGILNNGDIVFLIKEVDLVRLYSMDCRTSARTVIPKA